MTVQQFDTINEVRLDVAAAPEPGALVNLIQNPNGELGGWGWLTPLAGTAVAGTGTGRLRFNTTTTQAAYFTSEPLGMAAGQYAGARLSVDASSNPNVTVKGRFVFLDAAGAVISSGAQTGAASAPAVLQVPGALAPAGTVYVELRIDAYTSGGNLAAGAWVEVSQVVVATAATSATLGSVRTNLITQPSFEASPVTGILNVPGGSTAARSTDWAHVGTASLKLTRNTTTGTVGFDMPAIPVELGVEYAIQAMTHQEAGPPPRTMQLFAIWLDAGGTILDNSDVSPIANWSGGNAVLLAGTATAPSGAVTMRVRIRMTSVAVNEPHYVDAVMVERASTVGTYFDGATPDAGGVDYAWTGTPHASTSTATEAGQLAFIPPIEWLSILGTANQVVIDRKPLDVGTLTGTMSDATLDPATSDVIRPGRACRLTLIGNDEPLFTGVLRRAKVSYDLLAVAEKRSRIEFEATDHVTELANLPRSEGVATIGDLPHVLEGAGVPWNVNGSGDQVPTASVVAINDQATALDQIVLTRDSALGQAWVDRRNIVQAWDAASLPATVQAVLDETTYSDLNIDYDTERCINTVLVTFLRTNPDSGETEEVSYGPYVDEESVGEWGARSATFVIQWATEDPAAIAAYAADILAANATPAIRVNAVTVPIRTTADLGNTAGSRRATLELLDLVTVSNTAAGVSDNLRVQGITHTITPTKWTLGLSFARDGQVASPQSTPSPSGGGNGKTLGQLLRPVGEVTMWYGSTTDVPAGWLRCDGTAIPAEYVDLIALIGANTPNMVDVFPIGAGTKAKGTTGGDPTKTITAANLPSHSHNFSRATAVGSTGTFPRGAATDGTTTSTGATGVAATPMDVMNPWRALHFIIRAR